MKRIKKRIVLDLKQADKLLRFHYGNITVQTKKRRLFKKAIKLI